MFIHLAPTTPLGFHSIVLMAIVDANYEFVYVSVGAKRSCADGGIWQDSDVGRSLADGQLSLPAPQSLQPNDPPLSFFFVADDAFPLQSIIMKPYPLRGYSTPQRIFNYQLSRARRVV